jgi:GNAT superfamily N-acetyltransferase
MSGDAVDLVREATAADVEGICRFGEAVIPEHYAPLIGPAAAAAQVRDWWRVERISAAVTDGLVVLAERGDQLVGAAQRGRSGDDHVIYKLYLQRDARGHGLGRRLIDALVAQLPAGAQCLCVEHFAANERAGAFYEREGFAVERVDASPSGDPRLAVVWRARKLARGK